MQKANERKVLHGAQDMCHVLGKGVGWERRGG